MSLEKERHTAAEALADGCEHVETLPELAERIAQGRPLRVKLGIDPTTPDLHIGHAVVLHKMQEFVEAGHRVTLLIGDFTARIGDPTGRNEQRPQLGDAEIAANMRSYAQQAGKVLDMERVEVAYNSSWLGALQFADVIKLLAQTTVAQMLDRKDFAARYRNGTPIALHEFLYPVAQAYDSVALEADVELGGTDQLFNLLLGRAYQTNLGQPPQICMTVPLLEGIDGVHKMSKSFGNHIALTDPPQEQFGKLMRIPDELIVRYARLAAFWSAQACAALEGALAAGTTPPMEAKKRVAEDVVARYHSREAALAAREYFERTVQRREAPEEMDEIVVGDAKRLTEVLVAAKLAESKRAAERLIAGGGVRVDGVTVKDPAARWSAGGAAVVAVGARRFVRVVPGDS